jgi:hypothetical protein
VRATDIQNVVVFWCYIDCRFCWSQWIVQSFRDDQIFIFVIIGGSWIATDYDESAAGSDHGRGVGKAGGKSQIVEEEVLSDRKGWGELL